MDRKINNNIHSDRYREIGVDDGVEFYDITRTLSHAIYRLVGKDFEKIYEIIEKIDIDPPIESSTNFETLRNLETYFNNLAEELFKLEAKY